MHYLPHIPPGEYSPEVFGTALWLQRQYWKNMETAVANGISKAFGGES